MPADFAPWAFRSIPLPPGSPLSETQCSLPRVPNCQPGNLHQEKARHQAFWPICVVTRTYPVLILSTGQWLTCHCRRTIDAPSRAGPPGHMLLCGYSSQQLQARKPKMCMSRFVRRLAVFVIVCASATLEGVQLQSM